MADIDHRTMTPPSLRVTRTMPVGVDDTLYTWDFRLAQPNVSHVAMPVIHSLEHFLGSDLPARDPRVAAVAPMGCQTGFYVVALNLSEIEDMARLLAASLTAIGASTEVPLANEADCGWALNHSLPGVQALASWLLSRAHTWHESSVG